MTFWQNVFLLNVVYQNFNFSWKHISSGKAFSRSGKIQLKRIIITELILFGENEQNIIKFSSFSVYGFGYKLNFAFDPHIFVLVSIISSVPILTKTQRNKSHTRITNHPV